MHNCINPYEQCLEYTTEHFLLRLVRMSDAEDLLACYGDPKAAPLFNKDNCHHDFICQTVEDVEGYIAFWLKEYGWQGYVRFAVVDKSTQKAVGTLEIFARKPDDPVYGTLGVLRMDLASSYERRAVAGELLQVSEEHFYADFHFDRMLTKAVPEAAERIAVLEERGFTRVPDGTMPFGDYYVK